MFRTKLLINTLLLLETPICSTADILHELLTLTERSVASILLLLLHELLNEPRTITVVVTATHCLNVLPQSYRIRSVASILLLFLHELLTEPRTITVVVTATYCLNVLPQSYRILLDDTHPPPCKNFTSYARHLSSQVYIELILSVSDMSIYCELFIFRLKQYNR